MIEFTEMTKREKVHFPKAKYKINFGSNFEYLTEKDLKELLLQIEKIFKPNEPKTVSNNEQTKEVCCKNCFYWLFEKCTYKFLCDDHDMFRAN